MTSYLNRASRRIGLFGLLGQGNLGNDGSLEAVLAYLRAAQPDAKLDALCSGPDVVEEQYGIPATSIRWYNGDVPRRSGLGSLARRALGLSMGTLIDTVRIASWVRRHDSVIVPGMGVLETTVFMRPWHTPYRMFVLCAAGRLLGTRVALVSIGTNVTNHCLTRWLITSSARLAHYCSFRDTFSKDAMRQMGLDLPAEVYPDVVFSLPVQGDDGDLPLVVGVGIMDYSGGNDDRHLADELRADYIEKMTRFVLWLLENNKKVRLFTSDSADEPVIEEIRARVQTRHPLEPSELVVEPVTSLAELIRQTSTVGIVVAMRYHNVLYGLLLGRPTLSIGYAAKHDYLMAGMGMSRYSQAAKSLDVDRLIEQFSELESHSTELRRMINERNAEKARLVQDQFDRMSAALLLGSDQRLDSSQLAPVH